jgi:hypothetical protein
MRKRQSSASWYCGWQAYCGGCAAPLALRRPCSSLQPERHLNPDIRAQPLSLDRTSRQTIILRRQNHLLLQQQASLASIEPRTSGTPFYAWLLCQLSRWIALVATNTCCGGRPANSCARLSHCGAASNSRADRAFHSRSARAELENSLQRLGMLADIRLIISPTGRY